MYASDIPFEGMTLVKEGRMGRLTFKVAAINTPPSLPQPPSPPLPTLPTPALPPQPPLPQPPPPPPSPPINPTITSAVDVPVDPTMTDQPTDPRPTDRPSTNRPTDQIFGTQADVLYDVIVVTAFISFFVYIPLVCPLPDISFLLE